jgi:glycosyltransferase involved in cell wall biosynthesis
MPLYPITELAEVIYDTQKPDAAADIVVVIPLYNYEQTITETITSVVDQDLPALSVIVIDDCSTDGGGNRAAAVLEQHAARFINARLLRHRRNQGLSMTRNSGIAWSKEPYLFFLDADNRLKRHALSRLHRALCVSGAAFAYSQLHLFGDELGIGNADIWDPSRLRDGNYIDAMALIRRVALESVGGYSVLADDYGWEDYDLWCRFAEIGVEGVFVPELLCEYRVHKGSMLRTRTNLHSSELVAEMALRHPSLFPPEDEDTP